MLCHGLLLFSLLFFTSFTFFIPFSAAAPQFHSFHALPPAGRENVEGLKYEVEYLSWGSAVEAPISEPVETSTLVLAPRRTYRKDPLNGFKRYTGGWNISDRHYWASVGFTAVPLFAIAAVWFLGFGLCLLLVCLCYFCCGRKSYGYSQTAYVLSLIFLVVFSIGAIIGCVVLYTGQGKFHRSTTETLEYVVNQADTTVQKLRDVSSYLASAKIITVDNVSLPSSVQTDIDQIETRINSSASILADRTVENSDDIRDLLDSVRLALIVIAAIMLLLTFLGFLFSIFGIQILVYILVIVGWMLVAGTFILCGTFLLLHNVAADTCVAMNHWVQNPTAHTALDDVLPCVDSATAQETLSRSKEVTLEFVDVINSVITNVSNLNFSPNFPSMYFNQSGPLVPILCNPYYHDLTDRPCSSGEVDMNNATQVWESYVCQVSSTGICITTGRLTPTLYNQMIAPLSVCSMLKNYGLFLIELEDCTFVRETFDDIYRHQCPRLQRYSRWVYVGLVMVSTAVMLSIIFWVIYGRERHHRVSTKQLQAESAQGLEDDKRSQS
ncbi:uncharacterized protein LOC8280112 [Ricinus communis]|uniref:uncharacterized protein LOC8280112 n=1 Tax=Ricinus communis TaxID=3988 RepID=UPI00077238F5|nr:uncharacterized protein LOC8280112 [Ricinus communis]|eukprot:XP_015575054.1 uncharacterized protein LOC8280112 [Ricinus communis]